MSHKKPIPKFPKKIAVLTASTGAAIRDIHSTINSRFPLVEQIQISTLVQGEQAKNDIVEKLQYADTLGADVIILGRGGGSIEDLWNFNEEDVVRAIFNTQTPVISAVGHETDFTLSDFVADVRAATPTQAAVIATPDQVELTQYIKQIELSLSRHIVQLINNKKKHLEHVASYYKFKQPSLLYDQQIQRRDELEKQLSLAMTNHLTHLRQRIDLLNSRINVRDLKQHTQQAILNKSQLDKVLNKSINNILSNAKTMLAQRLENLNNLSPTNTMLRGYTIVNKDEQVITSTQSLKTNDHISLTMKDGEVDAIVKKVRCNKDE